VELVRERHTPLLMQGLRIDAGSSLYPDLTWPGTAPVQEHRTLLVVTSDQCQFCAQAEATLCTALRDRSLPTHDRVVLISFAGSRIPAALAGCSKKGGVARITTTLAVRSAVGFSARTGITATPSILLADADGTLVGSCFGGDMSRCASLLRGNNPSRVQ
jgi:hypothetical protein